MLERKREKRMKEKKKNIKAPERNNNIGTLTLPHLKLIYY